MNINSILNGIKIGKDISGNFKPSFEGLAVRTTADGKFFSMNKAHKQLVDVSDLTLDGGEAYVYRLPVTKNELKPGDLIITSEENPFRVLFIEQVHPNGEIKGLDPSTSLISEYTPQANLFIDITLYVKVVSLLGGFDQDEGAEGILPLLLLGSKGDNASPDNPLNTLLLVKALGGKTADKKLLPLLLLSGSKSEGLETVLLLHALGGTSAFGSLFSARAKK